MAYNKWNRSSHLFNFLEIEFREGVEPISQLHDKVELDDEPAAEKEEGYVLLQSSLLDLGL